MRRSNETSRSCFSVSSSCQPSCKHISDGNSWFGFCPNRISPPRSSPELRLGPRASLWLCQNGRRCQPERRAQCQLPAVILPAPISASCLGLSHRHSCVFSPATIHAAEICTVILTTKFCKSLTQPDLEALRGRGGGGAGGGCLLLWNTLFD